MKYHKLYSNINMCGGHGLPEHAVAPTAHPRRPTAHPVARSSRARACAPRTVNCRGYQYKTIRRGAPKAELSHGGRTRSAAVLC